MSPCGRSQSVNGPFVVEPIEGNTVHMRSTAQVCGQTVKQFQVHRERVARCHTLVNALEALLQGAGKLQGVEDIDALVEWHRTCGGVSSGTRQMS